MEVIGCNMKTAMEMRGCSCTEVRQLHFEIFLIKLWLRISQTKNHINFLCNL